MRSLASATRAIALAAIVSAVAVHPALAQSRPPVVPEPSSLDAIGAGTVVLIVIVCIRLFMLRRRADKEIS